DNKTDRQSNNSTVRRFDNRDNSTVRQFNTRFIVNRFIIELNPLATASPTIRQFDSSTVRRFDNETVRHQNDASTIKQFDNKKMTIQNSKVLVTGGAGFIGSNLIDQLLQQGNQVVCLDNFATGKRENLAEALQNPHFTLVEGDIRNLEDCQKAVAGCDYVLHQAALGSVPRSIADPMTTTDVNIGGFVKMLFAAKEAGVKRFVYAASSSTYGDHPALPKVEHVIGNSLSPYAITKYVDELFAKNFSDIYGIET